MFELRQIPILVLLLLSATGLALNPEPPRAVAQEQMWINLIKVTDVNSGVEFTNKPLFAGGIYNFTFRVSVPFEAREVLNLETRLLRVETQYWYLKGEYKGIDPKQWTPGRADVSFNQIKGEAVFSLVGRIPSTVTTKRAVVGNMSLTLHFTGTNYSATLLTVSSSRAVVGSIIITVVDQTISAYQSELAAKEQLIKTTGVDPSYAKLLDSVLNQARQLQRAGLVEEALMVLKSVPEGVPLKPKPPEESPLPTILGGGVVAVSGVAVVAGLLAVRARARLTLLKSLIEDEANKLDVSLVKLQRTDQSLASEVGEVKDRLKVLGS